MLNDHVTGVGSQLVSNLDLVRSLGADHVLDYTNEDFTKTGRTYDLVLDTIGNRSVGDLRGALAATGKAAVTGSPRSVSTSAWRCAAAGGSRWSPRT